MTEITPTPVSNGEPVPAVPVYSHEPVSLFIRLAGFAWAVWSIRYIGAPLLGSDSVSDPQHTKTLISVLVLVLMNFVWVGAFTMLAASLASVSIGRSIREKIWWSMTMIILLFCVFLGPMFFLLPPKATYTAPIVIPNIFFAPLFLLALVPLYAVATAVTILVGAVLDWLLMKGKFFPN